MFATFTQEQYRELCRFIRGKDARIMDAETGSVIAVPAMLESKLRLPMVLSHCALWTGPLLVYFELC